jgi:endonuclease/exonuclease/phosphatase family metal-dependent hydrolase
LRESIAAGGRSRRARAVGVLVGLVAVAGLAVAPGAEAKKTDKSVPVTVMTRNLFLGADLGPALASTSFQQFTAANGQILRDVDSSDFATRAKGLAKEIKQTKPDLVGLQEGAWWRTGPTGGPPHQSSTDPQSAFTATTNRYDFIQLLLGELNKNTSKDYKGYKLAVSNDEFDFEAPTDFDSNPSTGLFGGEIQARLTMRDAILVRKGGAVKVSNPQTGHYQNLYTPTISGIVVPVTRGWVSVDATATAGSGKDKVTKKFHFVDTHFESFDDETVHPSIRALQAQELTEGSGPYGEGPASAPNTILVGDLNSNNPPVKPGDEQAYDVVTQNGFSERSTSKPNCCVPSIFTGPASAFDHKVDHIMTNESKKKVKLVDSGITGLKQANGLYDSDHAGLFSTLELK